jgi:pilus assembly protein CpaF
MTIINIVLLMALFIAIIVLGIMYYRKLQKVSVERESVHWMNVDSLVDSVKSTFNDILKENLTDINLKSDELENKKSTRAKLRKSLKDCAYGNISAKLYIIEYIKDILQVRFGINNDNIDTLIHFSSPKRMSAQDKFEILLYEYEVNRGLGMNAFLRLIKDFKLDRPLYESSGDDIYNEENLGEVYYEISTRDIELAYNKCTPILYFKDKIMILARRVYAKYKGYDVADLLVDMRLDGISAGVSGITEEAMKTSESLLEAVRKAPYTYESVWIFFEGKQIRLSFLSFGSMSNLIRVCKLIYRYNAPGALSESQPYKVNELMDGSRVVVVRPPMCESWVFFVRKFDSIEATDIRKLITDTNSEMAIRLMRWLIKGYRIFGITGAQGTGKTTLLLSLIRFISPTLTLRIQEMAFELHLRRAYPTRNIVTFKETGEVDAQSGINLQKKTDGNVNILGEIAEAEVAALMLQMAQKGSSMTTFTHHAKTAESLITSLRDDVLQVGIFTNETIAEEHVARIINFDVHLEKDSITGKRWIERITEIVPLAGKEDYPKNYKNSTEVKNQVADFMDTASEYFYRSTDRRVFETRDIIRFVDGRYVFVQPITDHSFLEIQKFLSPEAYTRMRQDFQQWEVAKV